MFDLLLISVKTQAADKTELTQQSESCGFQGVPQRQKFEKRPNCGGLRCAVTRIARAAPGHHVRVNLLIFYRNTSRQFFSLSLGFIMRESSFAAFISLRETFLEMKAVYWLLGAALSVTSVEGKPTNCTTKTISFPLLRQQAPVS